MAIVSTITCCTLTALFLGAILALPFWCALGDFKWYTYDSRRRTYAAIKMAAYAAILVAVIVYAGLGAFIDASKQEADPKGYAIEQAQRKEGYYRVVALEPGGIQIMEDPNSGGLYARRDSSKYGTMAPLLNKDGSPMTVEDWEEVKENAKR